MIFEDFIWRALVAGIGIAICGAPLGCLMVWRRMAYFSDTLSHAALLGIAIGFFLKVDVLFGVLLIALLVAILLWFFRTKQLLSTDSFLAILTHTSLALGLVLMYFLPTGRVDLMNYLVGDLLTVTKKDLVSIYVGGLAILGTVVYLWEAFISVTLHEELAFVEGVPTSKTQFILFLLMALFVAISMQLIGVLLLSALLIIPAATARFFARVPEQMVLFAGCFGVVSVMGGLLLSLKSDIPTGPAIVLAGASLFTLGCVLKNRPNEP